MAPTMDEVFRHRRITRLDACFGGSLLVVSVALAVNVLLQSVHLVYATILLVLASLAFVTSRHGAGKSSLRALWFLAGSSVVLYPLVDYFFEARLGLVTYFANDPRIVVTPVYIPLYWALGVLLFGYFYYRVDGLIDRAWMAALATGLFSAASATFVENLFNLMGFYRNTAGRYMVGYIPLYVPLGYVIAFSFVPFYLRHKVFCGPVLYALVGISWYLVSRIVP